jgi:hypothetical protein
MNQDVVDFCEQIVRCVSVYGGMDELTARKIVGDSKICEVKDELDMNLLFHELPYYWAMVLLNPDNDRWYKDPNLWPPPHEEDWYRRN